MKPFMVMIIDTVRRAEVSEHGMVITSLILPVPGNSAGGSISVAGVIVPSVILSIDVDVSGSVYSRELTVIISQYSGLIMLNVIRAAMCL